MVINEKSSLFLKGRSCRVCSRRFNKAVPKLQAGTSILTNEHGEIIHPAKNKTWQDVSAAVRSGKSIQGRVE